MSSAGTRPGTALTTPEGRAVCAAQRCNFRGPSAHGRRAPQASRRPRGLRKRLHAVRDAAGCLPAMGREYAYAGPLVGPDLKIWAVPRHGEAELSRLGLSLPRNSQNRSRTGLKGITPHGKKVVRWSCRLLEDMRRKTAMWTVTLTDNDYLSLLNTGRWPKFQRRIHDLLVRYLKSYGDEAVVVGVVEVGPKRFARTGRLDPHIHVITSGWGRRRPDGQWLLCPDAMDELVAKACQYAGLPSLHRPSASRVEPVRHSVASYMSKYLTKELPVDVEKVDSEMQALIPHQWWFRSAAAKALVEGCLIRLPPAFAAFVARCHGKLEALGLGRGGYSVVAHRETLLGTVPIEMLKFRFNRPEDLHAALELYLLWASNNEELDLAGLVMSG